jgi:hydrogenase expression/formation protein HypD
MKYVDEYRDSRLFRKITQRIHAKLEGFGGELVFMEVCGTHTMAIFRSGIKTLLPRNIRLISGPGCPVCVTPNEFLDKAIAYARMRDVIIVSFGDMLRVPASVSSLEKERAKGARVKIVYSSLDALTIARENPGKKIIFLGVGFETTTPTVAATIKLAKEQRLHNFFVLSAHKLIPPAMKVLVESDDLNIDGFICPGHVSTIIGSRPYQFIADDYNIPCVIAGFEPLDIIQSVYILTESVMDKKRASVNIQYKRSVKEAGNPAAVKVMREVFEESDSNWRGLGVIPKSGLKIQDHFKNFDAESNIEVKIDEPRENADCICANVLKGTKTPFDCKLFRTACTPENPIGACMVSSEGTCAAFYKYEGLR